METSGAGAGVARTASPVSPRAKLAQLVLDAATSLPEVLRGHAGEHGMWVTPHPGHPLDGVVAVARPDGGYDLELHLVARPVPLHPLADQIRERIGNAAAESGDAGLLGSLSIAFEDVVEETLTVVHPPSPGMAAR